MNKQLREIYILLFLAAILFGCLMTIIKIILPFLNSLF